MLLFFGCRGVEGSVRFPSPSLPPHSAFRDKYPALNKHVRYAEYKIRMKFHVQVVQRTQELRNVSKFVMHLQTEKLFGFLNQSRCRRLR